MTTTAMPTNIIINGHTISRRGFLQFVKDYNSTCSARTIANYYGARYNKGGGNAFARWIAPDTWQINGESITITKKQLAVARFWCMGLAAEKLYKIALEIRAAAGLDDDARAREGVAIWAAAALDEGMSESAARAEAESLARQDLTARGAAQ